MTKFRTAVLAGVVLGLVGIASTSFAATMVATYKGTVFNSINQLNLFGTKNSLDDLAFEAVFVYDPATPGALRETGDNFDLVSGGGTGTVSPIQFARLTINGHSMSLGGVSSLIQAQDFPGIFNSIAHGVGFNQAGLFGNLNAQAASGVPPLPLFRADLDSSVALTALGSGLGADPRGEGHFFVSRCIIVTDAGCQEIKGTGGLLAPTSVTIAQIPIPAALPLLASGVAGLGIVAFRRRRRGHAA